MDWSIDKQQQGRARGRRRRAFTFVEVLVVVIIIGVLAALIVPSFVGRIGQSKQSVAKQKVHTIGGVIDTFYYDHSQYPQSLEDLTRRPSYISTEDWNGAYLKQSDLVDPWGNQFNYRSPGQHNSNFDLFSHGADNQPGGEDENADITNWDDGSSASASSS